MSLSIRQQLGKIKNRGMELFDRYNKLTPKWDINTIETALVMLPAMEKQLKRFHDKFEQWQTMVDDIEEDADRDKEEKLLNEWQENDDYANLIEDLKEAVSTTTRLSKNSSTRDNPSTSIVQLVPAKIAAQNIQKFDGEYLSFKPFWQRFVLNIDSKPYAKLDKLDILFGLLEGKALKEVEGTPLIEENYESVKQMLLDRFGNNAQILYSLHTQLAMIKPANGNADSLRVTVTAINRLCRQLKDLGVDINNSTLKYDIIRKMSTREQAELLLFTRSQPEVSTEEILKKMKEFECRAELIAEIEGKHSFHVYSGSQSPSKSLYCSFCDGNHASATCQIFKTIDEKFKQLKLKGSCFKCAGRNHSAIECRSKTSCRTCNGNHQTFLCKAAGRSNNVKTNAFVAVERKQSPMLAKEIIVKNPENDKEAKAIVFLDSGSQRNYVSNDLMNKLKLHPIATEVLNIEGIGGKKSLRKTNLVEIRIPTVEGSHLDIAANSISNIATTIPLAEIDDLDCDKYSIVKKQPDILVGIEDFFSIVTAVKERNGIFVVDSKIGPMISGKLDRDNQKEATVSCAAITSSSAAGEGLVQLENVELDKWWELHRKKYGASIISSTQFELG